MPRCTDRWRFTGDIQIGVTATAANQNQQYSLVYVLRPRGGSGENTPWGSFNSTELAAGVTWLVPEGHRCEFQLLTTVNGAIATQISLRGQQAVCNPGRHCQGTCTAGGGAGIAGFWRVTAARRAS